MKRSAPLRRKTQSSKRKRPSPMRRCDQLARRIVLARGRCEGRSGHKCTEVLQWAHIVTRSARWIRHDEDNALCLCTGEHFYFTQRHVEWVLFVGEDHYIDLIRRASDGLRKKIDWAERERMLTERCKQVEG